MQKLELAVYYFNKVDRIARKINKTKDDMFRLYYSLDIIEDLYGTEMKDLLVWRYNLQPWK